MKSDKVLKILNHEFTNAVGAPGGSYANERAEAMDRYLRQPYGNEEESYSDALTSEVADVVDGLMPSLMRMFFAAENLVLFDPVGPEDVAQADQATDYVHHVFFKENDAFINLFFWFFDALVQKIGVVMAYWDESTEVTTETYTGLSIDEVTQLLDDEANEAIEQDEREVVGPDGQPVIDPMTGEPVLEYDLKIQRKTKVGRVCIDPVPPEQYRISSDATSPKPNGRMVGREFPVTRSKLVKMGFEREQVAKLKAISSSTTQSIDERARKHHSDDTRGDSLDESTDLVMFRDAYIEMDCDEDGIAELVQVMTAGGQGGAEILRWEEGGDEAIEPVDRRPFHVLTPYLLSHKHIGQGVHDKVGEIQDTSTELLRQVLTNLYHTNNPGHGVSEFGLGENTLDDLLTTKVGRVVRFGDDPGRSYMPMTVPFSAGATFPMLEYFEKVKGDRTGVASDSEGLSPESLKHVQQTVLASKTDMSTMKQSLLAQTFAETGIKSLFLHIHELLIKHQDRMKMVQMRNRWVPVNPSEWRHRFNVSVNIGLGFGTREQNLLHLNAVRELQQSIVQAGGMNLLVTPQNIWNTASQYVKNANLQTPELYFTNPGDKMAPPVPDEAQKLQQQQQQLMQRQQQLDAQANQIKQQKVALDQQEAQLRHQRELMKLEEERERREDQLAIQNEKLRNDLLKLQQANPKIAAEIDRIVEETKLTEAQRIKTTAETAQILEGE